jgi:hypothetical protein
VRNAELRDIAAVKAERVERSVSTAMPSKAQPLISQRTWLHLDQRLVQGGIIIGAFATAAILAALYGPGPREASAVSQTTLPAVPTAAAPSTPNDNAAPSADETAAREAARRKIAEALNRQAEEAAAAKETATAEPPVPAKPDVPANQPPSPAPQPIATSIYDQDFEKLASKAARAVQIGDITGARLILEHAVDAGDATAIYALAETYDPRVLTKLHVRGMTGDADKARALYEQALAKGIKQAQAKLDPAGR